MELHFATGYKRQTQITQWEDTKTNNVTGTNLLPRSKNQLTFNWNVFYVRD